MTNTISREALENALSYQGFKDRVKELYDQGRPTSGEDADAPLLEFTQLNLNRMERNEKSNKLDADLQRFLAAFPRPMYWLVLAEGWCGDVAESLPVIHKVASEQEHITLGVIFRDQNPEIMDQYLTNGGRSIPKLIILDAENLQELANWGPRPQELQRWVDEKQKERDHFETKMDWVNSIHEGMHKWYGKDRGQSVQQELHQLLEEAQKQVVA